MISALGNQKGFICTTSYADVYSISYKETEALIFYFHSHIASCADFQKGLQRSMNLHQNLSHPNKMEIYTWNRDFIITEKAEMWDMSTLGHYERLSHKKQLLSLFSYAHSQKMVHGSLHSEFVFVRSDKSLAVMGWGFSQKSLPMIHLYRPPERYSQDGNMDCDLYAMALITYEIISKNKPWESRCTPYEIQMRKEKPLLRPLTAFGFSQTKSSIFMKALSNRPEERFQSLTYLEKEYSHIQKSALAKSKSPTVGRFYKTNKEPMYGRNQQNIILLCVAALLAMFIGTYEQSARAGGTSWKHGFSMRDGSDVMNGDGVGIRMIQIPGEHGVKDSLLMSETEITRKQWSLVMNTHISNSSAPKTDITWLDAVVFCNTLSLMNNKEVVYTIKEEHVEIDPKKNGYRLPTEKEWEYAAKGNKSGLYAGSGTLDPVAWTSRNTKGSVQKVKTKKPNTFGLYDMIGNAAEWVVSAEECPYNICDMNEMASTKGGSVRSLQRDHKAKVTVKINRLSKKKDLGLRIVAPNF
ncbi:MAG: hypothetical protein CL916_10560 [Deltaproteobacteria bacterium]|nr:hypothetical protein [Deltaproteobacteria bacterium]